MPIEPIRRPYLNNPEESLFLSSSPIEMAVRFGQFARDTGLETNQIMTSAMCSVPIPAYTDFGTDRRWPGTNVEMMWHPLMWLPEHLRTPQTVTIDGESFEEPFDFWVVRLCIELELSGAYDADTGTWIDVLSLSGLDIEDETVRARVKRWLDGARDDRLDAIDLTPYMVNEDDPTWSYDRASEMTEDLLQMSWAISAQALSEALDDLSVGEVSEHPNNTPDTPDEEYVWAVGERKQVAARILSLGSVSLEGASEFPWLEAARSVREFEGTDEELLAGPVTGARELLDMIVAEYGVTDEELDEAMAAAAQVEESYDGPREPGDEMPATVEPAGDSFTGGRRGGMELG